ncbi:kinase-like domain-containing protein [Aspergillus fumigatus]
MATIVGNPHGFFSYTSGRWIWDEEDQLRERYREFDILELQKVAMESASAESCVRMEKLGEGSYNNFFLLTMANGKAVAARIPNPNAGPVVLTTASEIATMDFLREILQVPVPKVLAWNATVNFANRVGAEYIIMEHAPGKNLADYRADMSLEHMGVSISGTTHHRVLILQWSKATACHPNSKKVLLDNSLLGRSSTQFWRKQRGDMNIDRGPWRSAADYLKALAPRERAWIEKQATPRPPDDPLFMSHSQNNPTEHISLLHRYISVVPYLLPKDGDLLSSFLWHIDLRTPNIFVNDNGNITSLIDWQSTWAGPLFFEARHPYFLNYNGELLLELPEDFKQLDEDTQTVVKDQVTRSILLYLYEKYTAERNPLLSRVLQYPNGMIMTDPVRFVGSTWDEDILPLRKSLIRVQK